MNKKYLLHFVIIISSIFIFSCSGMIEENDISDKDRVVNNAVDNLIKYARIQFDGTKSDIALKSIEPQWKNYIIFKQSRDTLAVNIPIYEKSGGESTMIIACMVGSHKKLFYVKLPGYSNHDLPTNIRKRLMITNELGEREMYRPIVNRLGKLKIARVRDAIIKEKVILNGGTLPEIIVYPGLSYDIDWWWWDFISGINGGSPPSVNYGGYVPPSEETSPKARADFYKAENIKKDAKVKEAITQLTKNVKADASKDLGRRERGFWVYYDNKTKKYYVGNNKVGEWIKGGKSTHAGVVPGSPMPSRNGDHIPKTATPVTFVHAHTPLSYEENCRRQVGPSRADMGYGDSNNIDMIVIDYVGNRGRDGKNYIYGGHDVNDSTTEYIYTPKK